MCMFLFILSYENGNKKLPKKVLIYVCVQTNFMDFEEFCGLKTVCAE